MTYSFTYCSNSLFVIWFGGSKIKLIFLWACSNGTFSAFLNYLTFIKGLILGFTHVYSLGRWVTVALEVVSGDNTTFYLRLLPVTSDLFQNLSHFVTCFPFCYASSLKMPFIIDLICLFRIC